MLREINDAYIHKDLVNLLYSKQNWKQKLAIVDDDKDSCDPPSSSPSITGCDEFTGKIPEIKISNIGLSSAFTYCGGNKLKNVSLLRYKAGGQSQSIMHRDKQCSNSHVATYLLFPPAVLCRNFTGGNLIVYEQLSRDKSETIVNKIVYETSKFDTWTEIYLKLGTLHEVSPLTSGARFVFKGEIHAGDVIPRDLIKPKNTMPAYMHINIENGPICDIKHKSKCFS
jgi:hypothetical protein